MSSMKAFALAMSVVVLGAGLASGSAEAKSSCVRAGGEATMITADLAKFMAGAALKNSINGMGAKPAGEVSMNCTENLGLTNCKAFQRACK